ncbi:hypothetical protein JD969_14205 [Planctomycetota bacterium]|nr:hypothetical protein JD969_14205 [Planctomycetota bacterium]
MKSHLLAVAALLICPLLLSGCIINSSSYNTVSKVIVDAPDIKVTGYKITLTDTLSSKSYTLPHTFKFNKSTVRPVVFTEAVEDTFATLRLGNRTFVIESDYPTPLIACNQSSDQSVTSSGSFAVPFIIDASSTTEEFTDYIYIGPKKQVENELFE